MVRLCAAALGLFAFGVTAVLGLVAGNPTDVTLARSLWAMFIFCAIGLGAGWVAFRVLDEHAVRRHREMFDDQDGQRREDGSGASDNEPPTAAPSAPEDEGAAHAQPAAAGEL